MINRISLALFTIFVFAAGVGVTSLIYDYNYMTFAGGSLRFIANTFGFGIDGFILTKAIFTSLIVIMVIAVVSVRGNRRLI